MSQLIYYADFKTLRQAYCEVKSFIETETLDNVSSLNTKIEYDLGCAGDDNLELLEKFVSIYQLDTIGFDYSTHFLSEGELFGSVSAFLTLLGLPVFISTWLLKIITFNKVDWTHKQVFPILNRETSDMTFGDLLTWYLTGKYTLRKDIQVRQTYCSN
jgi:hypothetical protein